MGLSEIKVVTAKLFRGRKKQLPSVMATKFRTQMFIKKNKTKTIKKCLSFPAKHRIASKLLLLKNLFIKFYFDMQFQGVVYSYGSRFAWLVETSVLGEPARGRHEANLSRFKIL